MNYFPNRTYPERANHADEEFASWNQFGIAAHAMDAGERHAVSTAWSHFSGAEGDWLVGRGNATSLVGLPTWVVANAGHAAGVENAGGSPGGWGSAHL